jgi:hypothetical protein
LLALLWLSVPLLLLLPLVRLMLTLKHVMCSLLTRIEGCLVPEGASPRDFCP